jgi:hypothetical protein
LDGAGDFVFLGFRGSAFEICFLYVKMSSEEFFILPMYPLSMRPECCMGMLTRQNQMTLRDFCRDIQSLVPLGLISMVFQGIFFSTIVKLSVSQAGL